MAKISPNSEVDNKKPARDWRRRKMIASGHSGVICIEEKRKTILDSEESSSTLL